MDVNVLPGLSPRTDPDGRILESIYDLFGNTTREKHTVGGVLKKDIVIAVDSLGRPTSATDQAAGGSGLQHTWSYPVNAEGGVTETQRYDASATVSTTISRAARGTETSRQTTYASGQSVTRTVNSRDTAERVTQATFVTNLTDSWSFDAAGRLARQWGTGYAAGAQTTDAYAYDPDTGQKTTDNVQLAYGGTIAASYTYDGNGRLDVATIGGAAADHTFDGAGNLSSIVAGGATTAFLYDSANRLTQKNVNGALNTKYQWNATYGWRTSQGPTDASQPITYTYTATGRLATYSDATRSLTATYSYDASGQRTRAVVTQSGATTTTDYKYDGLTLLGFTATQGSASWRIDYLYDEDGVPYGGIYRDPASSTTPTVFGILATDRGDVVELSDTAGAPFCAYRYDAWGNPTSTTTQATGLITSTLAANIAARQLLRYASYCYDSESFLYYCSARSYDPATRQWLSRDPAEADGEESAYQYCGGEPMGSSDPSGMYNVRTAIAWWHIHSDRHLAVRIRLAACWRENRYRVWDVDSNLRVSDRGYKTLYGTTIHQWRDASNNTSSRSGYYTWGGYYKFWDLWLSHGVVRFGEGSGAQNRGYGLVAYYRGKVGLQVWPSARTDHYLSCSDFRLVDRFTLGSSWPRTLRVHRGWRV